MKLTIVFLTFMLLPAFAGCSSHTYKRVLKEVDHGVFSAPWVVLRFEYGLEVQIRTSGITDLYVGHYQEITVSGCGDFVSNKCDTYDDMVSDMRKRPYEDPALVQTVSSNSLESETLESETLESETITVSKDSE